jgi:hypothetical protein
MHAFVQQIAWNQYGTHVATRHTRTSSPFGVEIVRREEQDAFLIRDVMHRHQYVPRSQDFVLHFDGNRLPDVKPIADLASVRTYTDRAQLGYLTARKSI